MSEPFYTWVGCISRTNMNPFPRGRASHLDFWGVASSLAQFARGPLLCIVISDCVLFVKNKYRTKVIVLRLTCQRTIAFLGLIFFVVSTPATAFDLNLYCRGEVNFFRPGESTMTFKWEDFVEIRDGRYQGYLLEIDDNKIGYENIQDSVVIFRMKLNRFTGELHIIDSPTERNQTQVTNAVCEKVTKSNRKF
jgi:hypothetical protein